MPRALIDPDVAFEARIRSAMQPAPALLVTINGEIVDTLEAFLAANVEGMGEEEAAAVRVTVQMKGETFTGGGGAGAAWSVRRYDGKTDIELDRTPAAEAIESRAGGHRLGR